MKRFCTLLGSPPVHEGGAGNGVEDQIELTAESLWRDVSGRLRSALNDTTYGTGVARTVDVDLGDA